MRAHAEHGHAVTAQQVQARDTQFGIARDRAARKEFAARKDAEAAELQAQRENRQAKTFKKEVDEWKAKADRATNPAEAEDIREIVAAKEAIMESHLARARQAQLDAADANAIAADEARKVTKAEVSIDDIHKSARGATDELDELQIQAGHLERAATKYEAAARATDQGTRDRLLAEAQQAEASAKAMSIDTAKIREVVPAFPSDPSIGAPGAVSSTTGAGTGEVVAEGDITGEEAVEERSAGPTQTGSDSQAGAPNDQDVARAEQAEEEKGVVQEDNTQGGGEARTGSESDRDAPEENVVGDGEEQIDPQPNQRLHEQTGSGEQGTESADGEGDEEEPEERENGTTPGDSGNGASLGGHPPAGFMADSFTDGFLAEDSPTVARVSEDDQGFGESRDDADEWLG
jgi:hypothetical protein